MQFGFVQGGGATDAIFIIHQLQEKYIAANKPLYFDFVDLEKALTAYPGKFFGGRPLGVLKSKNGLHVSSRACTWLLETGFV